MKKVFYGILAFAMALTLSSCEKSYYEVEEITEIQEIHPTIVNIDVPQDAWKYSYQDNNNYFYATVKMPEITEKAFKGGMIKMYRYLEPKVQIEMPYVRLNEQLVGDTWVFYTETVDYEFTPGEITIIYTASDFDYEIDETFVPDAMKFRCAIIE